MLALVLASSGMGQPGVIAHVRLKSASQPNNTAAIASISRRERALAWSRSCAAWHSYISLELENAEPEAT